MAGFLDPKQRVMDVIITELGRQQMMKGEFDVKFVSFSDKCVDYRDQGDGVLEPITDRLFFEASSQASDEIIPEVDGLGKFIIDQEVPGTLEVRDGVLYEVNNAGGYEPIDGYSRVSTFPDNTVSRFNSLEILNTITNVTEFTVSTTQFETVVSTNTVADPDLPDGVEDILPLAVDPRFENQINMRFLPPKYELGGSKVNLGAFNKWTTTEESSENYPTVDSLTSALQEIESASLKKTVISLGDGESKDYLEYNILGQIFVKKAQSLKKYVIIDAGEYFDVENTPVARIFFLGFVYKDGLGITKFVREFSLVFHTGGVE